MISRDQIKETFLIALDAQDPSNALYDSAKTLKVAGATRNDLYCTALDLRDLYDPNSDRKYDHLADLLDCLWGYCSLAARLFPNEFGEPNEDLLHRCRNCGDPQSVHSRDRCCAECECRKFLP